jgi:hypothetical protein
MKHLIAAGLILTFAAPLARPIRAQSIFVTTVADVVDFAAPQTAAQLPGPDGVVSMREAALAANNTAGPQTIGFQVPMGQWGTGTTGPEILNDGDPFPIEGDETTLDGTTQTLFTGDTNPDGAEVSFHSTAVDVEQIQSGIFEVAADRCRFIALGDMTGRNYGIDLLPSAEENEVLACTITGVFAAVRVQGDRNVIGGAAAGAGNRLSSLSDGLRIQGLGADPAVENVAVGNVLSGGFNGVQIIGNASSNRIGGFAPGEANLIAGAGYFQEDGTPDGAMVRIEGDRNLVLGNLVGTDPAGTSAADNPGDVGIEIYGDFNAVRGNVIGGITGLAGPLSVQAGIHLREGAEQNLIQGNWIGVDASGLVPIPNRVGILVSAFDGGLPQPGSNTIGGTAPGQGNVIAHNQEGGVVVLLASAGNRIAGNEIRDNHGLGGLGIDLGGDGATPNDPGDADVGPNGLANWPVVLSAVASAQGTVVTGQLDTPSPQLARVELFSNPAPAPGEVVEARTLLGAVSPNESGAFFALLPGDSTGLALTATSTDAAGNTSEIAPHVLVQPSPWLDLGLGLAGSSGVPVLAGGGTLAAGTPVALVLAQALAGAPGLWIVGSTPSFLPLLGGTLVPSPEVLLPFTADAGGAAALSATWSGAPSGSSAYAQAWILDAGGVLGAAASNGIVGTAP